MRGKSRLCVASVRCTQNLASAARTARPSRSLQFLQTYNSIDIALDTFPYNGGTTTTEAIWQGVPVITFYGDRWASRTSASILRAGNLNQFVADDLDAYIRLAVNLATDSAAATMLEELRRTMRDQLRGASVCDTQAFATEMEALYQQIVTTVPASR
jgi:predicted O-linked N-acetylglucosamine transferase (SPINDLY family)